MTVPAIVKTKAKANTVILQEGIVSYYRRLRDLREDHDLTQQQVAEYLHRKQPQYNRCERGLRGTPSDVLIALAKLYHTTTDYVLGLTDRE